MFGVADSGSRAESRGWSMEKFDGYFSNFISIKQKSHDTIFSSGRHETIQSDDRYDQYYFHLKSGF